MKALKRTQTSSSSNSNSPSTSSSSSFSWIQLRSVLFVVASSSPASCSISDRGRLKSPWSLRKRKHVLSSRRWQSMLTSDGKLNDGGIQLLKKVRSGGVDPKIRAEVWPFLLGVYDLGSSKEEREIIRTEKRREYEKLRRQCRRILKRVAGVFKVEEAGRFSDGRENRSFIEGSNFPGSENDVSDRESRSSDERCPRDDYSDQSSAVMLDGDDGIKQIEHASVVYDSDSKQIEDASVVYDSDSKQIEDASVVYDTDSLETDSSDDPFMSLTFPSLESGERIDVNMVHAEGSTPSTTEVKSILYNTEDFATWQRIIRLDAIRADGEYISYSPSQAAVEDDRAQCYAEAVGLKDYDQLEPCRILHASRLVAILEAYALYDPEIGYCQGMSDLLSPIITVMTEDHEAFWCFVEFMKKARHNFRLDERGIRRQIKIVSKIIKYKDSHLYRHLEKLQAEDCFFVYRMVVVLFRRELTFEQTICLWEVIWADQAAIRASSGKSGWNKIRHNAPPTDDLLLYAVAASVLQRRKQIIEKYSSMDEILKECNSMAGHLDVWKLLDDAHNLVVTLHDKT